VRGNQVDIVTSTLGMLMSKGSISMRCIHRNMKRKAKHKNTAMAERTLDKREHPTDLMLLDLLIQKIIKKLEDKSYEPKIQDALKAIQLKQGLVKTSEAEKTFWQLIDDIRRQELGPASLKTQNSGNELPESTCSERSESKDQPETVRAQILRTIIGLKEEVKRGMLPVKTITDSFNQGKCKESQFTYQRIGRILSAMGFAKGKVGSNSGILWDQENIERLEKIHGLHQTQETRETQETPTSGMNHKDSS
jgi:hypothetical protein